MKDTCFLVVGERTDNEFVRILSQWKIPWARVSLRGFLRIPPDRYESVLFMPGYFEWGADLDFKEQVLCAIKRARQEGRGFYSEYVQADDYPLADAFIFKQNYPPRPVGLERAVVRSGHYITQDFADGAVLPVRDCVFLPGQRRARVLLAFAAVLGTREVLPTDGLREKQERPSLDQWIDLDRSKTPPLTALPPQREIWPALISLEGRTDVIGEGGMTMHGNRWLCATFELSRFREKDFPLSRQWERLAQRILLYLMPASMRKRNEARWLAAGKIRSAAPERITGANRRVKYREALDRLMTWYFKSGVMPRPDGTGGVFEGFRSLDHALIPVLRSDCNTESALAIYMYGRLTRRKRYLKAAEAIIEFLWKKGWQDRNPKHPTCGLWKFYDDYEDFTAVAYQGDNGEAVRALCMLHHWTGRKPYLESALLTAEKFMRIKMHLKSWRVEGFELNSLGVAEYLRQKEKAGGVYHKHIVGPDAAIAYLHVYQATGDRRYLQAVEAGFSAETTNDIFLLSFLYALTRKAEYRRQLAREMNCMQKFQQPSGAIVIPGKPDFIRDTNRFYGLTEVDVRHQPRELIADQLYVNGKLAPMFLAAWQVTGDREYETMAHRLLDFLVRIQVRSDDRRLHGAWMRAYDCDLQDYYGSNGDVDWGPYCIESGWTNAWIGMALATALGRDSLIPPI